MAPRLIIRAWKAKWGNGSATTGMVELLCSEFNPEEQARIIDEWLETFTPLKAKAMLMFIEENLKDKVFERRFQEIIDSNK